MFNQFPNVFYIPKNVDYIIVSDLFAENYIGGAELTLEAILEECPGKIFKLHSSSVTEQLIEKNKDKYWILGNFSNMSHESLITLVTNEVKFSIIECDYKYCKFRSSHLHKIQEKIECNCHTQKYGFFIRKIFQKAQHVFFMSKNQMEIYINKFPQFECSNFSVQSSTFKNSTLEKIRNLRLQNKNTSSDTWVVLAGGSWIKAEAQTIKYCEGHKIKYERLGGLEHEKFLEKLSEYKGIVFLPAGYDTAPRYVIESKLLGLESILNENVQMREEDWFTGSIEDCENYLKTRPKYFWEIILNEKEKRN